MTMIIHCSFSEPTSGFMRYRIIAISHAISFLSQRYRMCDTYDATRISCISHAISQCDIRGMRDIFAIEYNIALRYPYDVIFPAVWTCCVDRGDILESPHVLPLLDLGEDIYDQIVEDNACVLGVHVHGKRSCRRQVQAGGQSSLVGPSCRMAHDATRSVG